MSSALDDADFLAGILNNIARTSDAQQQQQHSQPVLRKPNAPSQPNHVAAAAAATAASADPLPEGFQSTKRRGSDEQESTKVRRTQQHQTAEQKNDDQGDDESEPSELAPIDHDDDEEFSTMSADSDSEPRRPKRSRKPSAIAVAANLTTATPVAVTPLHFYAGPDRLRNPARMGPRQRTSPEHQFLLEKVFASDPLPNTDVRKLLAQQMKTSPRRVQIWFQNRRATVKRIAKERGEVIGAIDFRATRVPLSAATLATLLASENETQSNYERMRLHVADEPPPIWSSTSSEPSVDGDNSHPSISPNWIPPPPPSQHRHPQTSVTVNLARLAIRSLLTDDDDQVPPPAVVDCPAPAVTSFSTTSTASPTAVSAKSQHQLLSIGDLLHAN